MEDLQNLHYIKKKELSALDHKFYDDSDEYRLKKRKELYEKPIDKENFSIYSSKNKKKTYIYIYLYINIFFFHI